MSENKIIKNKMRLSIDEGGCLGLTFDKEKQSSRFFILTGVIDGDLKNTSSGDVIKDISLNMYGKVETKKIHYRDATALQKQFMVNKVAEQKLETITVVTDKRHFKDKNLGANVYNDIVPKCSRGRELYLLSLEKLLIQVSKHIENKNIELVVDIAECGGTISNKMAKKLIKKLIEEKKINDCFGSIGVIVANQRCSLQVADIIASSIFSALEPSQLYMSMNAVALMPIMLKESLEDANSILDYGICFTHIYDESKVFSNYPWIKDINYVHSMLFPKREEVISII